ncbi:MAG: DUF2064 domain-containing protein [Candidatus Thorarchaeota archaeon]
MKKTVIIFTKVPEVGSVKTRLAQTSSLNDVEVTNLAKAMLMDTILLSSELNIDYLCLGYYPEDKKDLLLEIIDSLVLEFNKNIKINLLLQSGNNFDERFQSVISSAIKSGFDYIAILGADLPYLHPKLISKTFNLLKRSNSQNIIIGPAGGGGIYLLGLSNKFNPNWIINHQLFRGGVEISQFVKLAKRMHIKLDILPPLIDIDLEEDLVSFLSFIELMSISNYEKYYHYPKYTAKLIQELKLYIDQELVNTRRRTIKKRALD